MFESFLCVLFKIISCGFFVFIGFILLFLIACLWKIGQVMKWEKEFKEEERLKENSVESHTHIVKVKVRKYK